MEKRTLLDELSVMEDILLKKYPQDTSAAARVEIGIDPELFSPFEEGKTFPVVAVRYGNPDVELPGLDVDVKNDIFETWQDIRNRYSPYEYLICPLIPETDEKGNVTSVWCDEDGYFTNFERTNYALVAPVEGLYNGSDGVFEDGMLPGWISDDLYESMISKVRSSVEDYNAWLNDRSWYVDFYEEDRDLDDESRENVINTLTYYGSAEKVIEDINQDILNVSENKSGFDDWTIGSLIRNGSWHVYPSLN